MAIETATLGGGCFWCLDAAFRGIKGVESVVSGYAGGATERPTYQQICTGKTGHAEVVQVSFDRDQIDFETILDIFFSIHDPTTLNRQGADVGTQYRSVIFYHTEAQRQAAERVIARLTAEGIWSDPIVTQVEAAPAFYPGRALSSGLLPPESDAGLLSGRHLAQACQAALASCRPTGRVIEVAPGRQSGKRRVSQRFAGTWMCPFSVA
jgi:peptide-methionine (S)-S-oxide reductase